MVGASDRLRLARTQNSYFRKNAQGQRTSMWISTEVVLYKPGGTSAFITELRTVASRCRVSRRQFGTTTWQRGLVAPRFLLPGSAVAAGVTAYANGARENTFVVAQQKGNVASILYITAATDADVTATLNRLATITTRRLGEQGLAVPVPSK